MNSEIRIQKSDFRKYRHLERSETKSRDLSISLCFSRDDKKGIRQRNEVTVLRDYKLTMQLKELQQLVDEWIKTVGVRYFDELTNLWQLVEEVGELSRIIIRTYGEQSVKEWKELWDLWDELADILFVLACIANQTWVDLNDAFEKNMSEKKNGRDLLRHVSNEKLNKG